MANPADNRRIDRALGYPYARPAGSYLFVNGWEGYLPPDFSFDGRIPVLACGSNAAPERLADKYKNLPDTVIPVTAATLRDIACCYSAHITGYGAMAATLDKAPGALTRTHITWLTEGQLDVMHESEALGINYHYVRMDGIDLTCERQGMIHTIHAYISLHGSYLLNGTPVILPDISCENAPFPILDQHAMQQHLLERCSPASALADFIRQNIDDTGLRTGRTASLAASAGKFRHPALTTILDRLPE